MRYALLAVLGQDGAAYDRLPNARVVLLCLEHQDRPCLHASLMR